MDCKFFTVSRGHSAWSAGAPSPQHSDDVAPEPDVINEDRELAEIGGQGGGVHHDGPVSVKGAYTPIEISDLASRAGLRSSCSCDR